MSSPSLSIEAFNDRIGETDSVVQAWPFADLVPAQEYRTDIGSEWGAKDGIAVGRILFVYDNSAIFSVHNGYYGAQGDRIWLTLENRQTAQPWKQMVGVAAAMEVSIDPSGKRGTYRPENILAVEPPMSSPEYTRAYGLGSKHGYVHGIVGGETAMYRQGAAEVIEIEVPGMDELSAVECYNPPRIMTPEGYECDVLYRGDIIRAQTAQSSSMFGIYVADHLIRKLGSENN